MGSMLPINKHYWKFLLELALHCTDRTPASPVPQMQASIMTQQIQLANGFCQSVLHHFEGYFLQASQKSKKKQVWTPGQDLKSHNRLFEHLQPGHLFGPSFLMRPAAQCNPWKPCSQQSEQLAPGRLLASSFCHCSPLSFLTSPARDWKWSEESN